MEVICQNVKLQNVSFIKRYYMLSHLIATLPFLTKIAVMYNVDLMLGQRRRRWPNIRPTLDYL